MLNWAKVPRAADLLGRLRALLRRGGALDFLPAVRDLMSGWRGRSRDEARRPDPVDRSAALAPSGTLRAGAPRRGRSAVSWTA
jgi:hypothetical protein